MSLLSFKPSSDSPSLLPWPGRLCMIWFLPTSPTLRLPWPDFYSSYKQSSFSPQGSHTCYSFYLGHLSLNFLHGHFLYTVDPTPQKVLSPPYLVCPHITLSCLFFPSIYNWLCEMTLCTCFLICLLNYNINS